MPLSPVNPYTTTRGQEGFGVLGGPHLFVAVTEAATRALRAVWHQKWLIHRRLRPEAMGARADHQRQHPQAGLIDDLVLQRESGAQAALGVGSRSETSRSRFTQYERVKRALTAAKTYGEQWKKYEEYQKKKAAEKDSKDDSTSSTSRYISLAE